jgi:hypothetical protein
MLLPVTSVLLGYPKNWMASFTANSLAQILSEIRRIFHEIPKETLVAVYDKSITWLE